MDLDELYPASFRGVFWYATRAVTGGGRKTATKSIIDSNRQIIEDLGKQSRAFTVNGVVSARRTNDGQVLTTYVQARDELLEALEQEGTGVLVHPFLGRVLDVACLNFSLDESLGSLGESPISITFGISDSDGVPVEEETSISAVTSARDAAVTALESDVDDLWSVTTAFVENVPDAISKVNDFVEDLRSATNPLTKVAGEIDSFSKELSDLSGNVAALVLDPADLSDAISSAITSAKALVATPGAVFDAMRRLFDYGDADEAFDLNTAARIERRGNRDLINSLVQGTALSEAYAAAAELDYPTVRDIDETQDILEAQYQKLLASGVLEADAEDALATVRVQLTNYLNDKRATAPRIVEIRVHSIPARVLAYSLYGSSELGTTIAELNEVDDASFMDGVVEVLSS